MYLPSILQSFKNASARIIKFTRKNDHITLGLYVQSPFENFSFKMAVKIVISVLLLLKIYNRFLDNLVFNFFSFVLFSIFHCKAP